MVDHWHHVNLPMRRARAKTPFGNAYQEESDSIDADLADVQMDSVQIRIHQMVAVTSRAGTSKEPGPQGTVTPGKRRRRAYGDGLDPWMPWLARRDGGVGGPMARAFSKTCGSEPGGGVGSKLREVAGAPSQPRAHGDETASGPGAVICGRRRRWIAASAASRSCRAGAAAPHERQR